MVDMFPAEMGNEARLFPLPDFVMFPAVTVPFHIFEGRYREMFEDAIRGDHLITIATLLPGNEHEYYSRPPLASHACVGRVLEYQKSPEGTYHFLLAGIVRGQIDHEIEPVRSFRRARLEIREDQAVSDDLARDSFISEIGAYFPAFAPLIKLHESGRISLGQLADSVAFHLPFSSDKKLSWLAETDPAQRVRSILEELQEEAQSRKATQYPTDFSAN